MDKGIAFKILEHNEKNNNILKDDLRCILFCSI